jgi:triacylglycerol lipase
MQITGKIAQLLARFDPAPVDLNPTLAPVVLVHGIHCNTGSMERMARALRAAGRETHVIQLHPADGSVGIEVLAQQLADFIDQQLGRRRFHLIGYSMGGLVSRYYLQRLGGMKTALNCITLSTPHRGTVLAYLNSGTGGRQMRPGSAFLQKLNADADALLPFLSLWTFTDLIIVPATSSRLPGLPSQHFFGWCHACWIFERRCIRHLMSTLERLPMAEDV